MVHSYLFSSYLDCFVSFWMSRARHWCFTLNNWTEDEYAQLEHLGTKDCTIEYLIIGKEVGEEGTPHLQGFCSFRVKQSLRGAKRFLGVRCHLEAARGRPYQAAEYCRKEGEYVEFGKCPPGSGARTDLVDAVARVKSGATKSDLIEESPALLARYPRFFSELFLSHGKSRDWETQVFVYYGETGIGKTRKAFEESNRPYMHSGGCWFDGYDGEEEVIFDDFGGSEFKLTYLLKLLDRYPMKVPVKGGFVNWIPKKIWITSNYSPKEWYANAKDEHVRALLRRLTKVVRFRRLVNVLNPVADYEEENIVE
jgi:hypothetical protein